MKKRQSVLNGTNGHHPIMSTVHNGIMLHAFKFKIIQSFTYFERIDRHH